MKLPARRIAPGQAEGTALVSATPFSFVGGVDPATGTIQDEASGARGESLAGRVFAFPMGKGSTVGSYVLYGLSKRGIGPAALINERAEGIVAIGAILGGMPMVDTVDVGALLSGDRVRVDADAGLVNLPDVTAKPVVSAFLRNRGRFLVVHRSEAVGSFQGRWSAISGYIEGDEDPRERALQEIREETGIREAVFRGAGDTVTTRHGSTAFVVHPFLFDVSTRRVTLDWENVESRWISPNDLRGLVTVPRLSDVLSSALKGGK
jgi:predicted aconitase with swiveling domain